MEIKTTSTMDVSVENDTYNINSERLPANQQIAAYKWLAFSNDLFQARLQVLRLIFNIVTTYMPKYILWCLVGDSAWQSDTRIVRYNKLFKRLKARGVEITHASEVYESMIEHQGQLKFFGATLLSDLSVQSVIKMIAEERCLYLLATPSEFDIRQVIDSGWEADDFIDKELLSYVSNNNSIIYKVIGEFDDLESGFVGLGLPELMKKLDQSS